MSPLTTQLETAVSCFPGTAAILIQDLGSDETLYQYNKNVVFPAASLIKLPILWEFYRQVENGRISPTTRLTLADEHKVGGAGVLQSLQAGLQPTLQDLATLMIITSDNAATNLLIDLLGMATINQAIQALGLVETRLQRHMMDFEQARAGFENYTTAAETAVLLHHIYALPTTAGEAMRRILQHQLYNDRLSANWPEEEPFAHKTGNLTNIEHDAGIWYGKRPILLITLTKDAPNPVGAQLCRAVGQAVYEKLRSY